MGDKVFIYTVWLVLVITNAMKVDITDVWQPNVGWKVTCTWQTLPNDTLQSVRLSNNGQQFMIFRPEKHGPTKRESFRTPQRMMTVDCEMTEPGGQKGQCILTVEPYEPPVQDFAVMCEVSGERPTFRIEQNEHIVIALVPPSDATIVTKAKEDSPQPRVSLNCSSSGLPAPNLLWTVADDKVQADFTDRIWNSTSKLWHVWSFFTYAPANQASTVKCNPEINFRGEKVMGRPAEYNSAVNHLSTATLLSAVSLVLHLIR